MSISDANKLNILYKKYFGVANAFGSNTPDNEYVINARPKVIPTLQMFKSPVPTAVSAYTKQPDTVFNTNNASKGIGGLVPKRYYLNEFPYMKYYENIPLSKISGGTNAYRSGIAIVDNSGNAYDANTPTRNLLVNVIPANLDPLLSYKIEVRNINESNALIASGNASYPWILDGDAGVLTFYNGTATLSNAAGDVLNYAGSTSGTIKPVISFWRYEGDLGQNDITVANGGAGRVVTTVDAAGNMTANPSVVFDSASSTLDLSNNSLKLKNVLLAAAGGSSDFTIKFPAAGPTVDNSGTVYNLALDQSGNIVYRNANTAESKFIDAAQFSLISDLTQRLDDVSGSETTERLIGLSDSYTSAIAKLDNWLYRNIVSAPPSIDALTTSANVTRTSSAITIWWYYPAQFNVGITDSYLPAINSFSAVISGNGSTTVCDPAQITKALLTGNQAQKEFIGRSATRMRAIVLSNTASSTTYALQTINGTSNVPTLTFPLNANKLNATGNNMSLYYANNNTDSNLQTVSVSFDTYLAAAPPDPVYNLSATVNATNNTLITNGITINGLTGTNVDSSNPTSTATIIAIDISAVPTAISTTNVSLSSISGFSYNVSGLSYAGNGQPFTINIPTSQGILQGVTYSIKVSARNSLVATYSSPTTINSVQTPVINGPSTTLNTNIASTLSTGFYSTPTATSGAKLASNNTSIASYGVFNAGANTTLSSSALASQLAIHTSTTKTATDAVPLANLKVTVDATGTAKTATANYTGFGTTNYNSVDQNGITITGASGEDFYAGEAGKQGYYMVIKNNPKFIIHDSTILTASKNVRTIDVAYDASGATIQNATRYSYYIDNTTGTPSISNAVLVPKTLTYTWISGVRSLITGSTFDISCNISNIGRYIYKSQFVAINRTSGSTIPITATNEDNLARISPAPDANGLLQNSLVLNTSVSGSAPIIIVPDGFYTGVSVNCTPSNLIGSGSAVTTSAANSYLIDALSYALITTAAKYPAAIPTTLGTSDIAGMHVKYPTVNYTGASADFAPLITTYVHGETIVGTQHLQIANGAHRSSTTNNGNMYLNYTSYAKDTGTQPDYSGLANQVGDRFSTFAWKIANTTTSYSKLIITLHNTTGMATQVIGGTTVLQNFKLYYRIVNGDANAPGSNGSSIWLNGNSDVGYSGTLANTAANSGDALGVVGGLNGSVTSSTDDYIFTLKFPGASFSAGNYYVNVIIGLPMNQSAQSFEYVTAKFAV
jgi:hypothetical protein